jgi:hypothetical protein
MLAVSGIYRSIYIGELALKLVVTHEKAEKIAASMIMDGSLQGSIDQVSGLVEFYNEVSPSGAWDKAITSFCVELNNVTESIQSN